jgi:hypothetical protein
MSDNRKADMLRKVRALYAQAEGTAYPEEADTFRAKADQIMTAYAIMEWELDQSTGETHVPINRRYDFGWYWDRNLHETIRDQLWTMFYECARFARCKAIPHDISLEGGRRMMMVLGMESDLDYFDMTFTSLMIDMLGHMEPKPRADLPMIENLVIMKEAGMKWERIGGLLYDAGQLDAPYTRNTGVRFTKLYTDYCNEHNRKRLYTSPAVYQRSFAEGFGNRVWVRLSDMRRARDTDHTTSAGDNRYALVVRLTQQKVEDLYAEMYAAYLAEQERLREAAKHVKTKAVSRHVRPREYKRDVHAIAAGDHAGKLARIVQPGDKIGGSQKSIDAGQ